MSRSGYTDDGWDDESAQWAAIRYAGALKSAVRGKKGQAFLRELLAALDAMPVKRLIREHRVMTPEKRWLKMRDWVASLIAPADTEQETGGENG